MYAGQSYFKWSRVWIKATLSKQAGINTESKFKRKTIGYTIKK